MIYLWEPVGKLNDLSVGTWGKIQWFICGNQMEKFNGLSVGTRGKIQWLVNVRGTI